MGAGETKQRKFDVASKQVQLEFDQIVEEKIDTDTIEQQENDKRQAYCDRCFMEELKNVIALYMCVVCEKYFCVACFNLHYERNKSHTVIRVKSKSEKNDGFDDFMSVVENESEKERNACLRKTNVCVCDYVNTKHGLDKDNTCHIYGLTGCGNKWWVVSDNHNHCIKVFNLGSNVLQRYIKLGSQPWDVSEIIVENKTIEQDSASCNETSISETDNKPDRKQLLAVTLPRERHILIIDLGKNPAVIHSKFKTEKQCESIDFYDGNIYAVWNDPSRDPPRCSVSIISLEGVTLKTFWTDILDWYLSYLTILNGNIYMTDRRNDRVICYNDEGRVLHEIKIDGSDPRGICVNRSDDKVYICACGHHRVYELKSDLSQYKSVLDQTTPYMWRPDEMCFYSDKVYVSHWSRSLSHVVVVRLV